MGDGNSVAPLIEEIEPNCKAEQGESALCHACKEERSYGISD